MARIGLMVFGACIAYAMPAAHADSAPDSLIIPLSAETRVALEPLGEGVVGAAIPARPIDDPAKLYHLRPGHWEYRILAGANRGQVVKVDAERVTDADHQASWELVSSSGDVQQFRVTEQHEVVKLSQEDAESDRLVTYRPGLMVDPDMKGGASKSAHVKITSYKREKRDKAEYDGTLDYTTTYLGAYRIETPVGAFDTRLLRHEYHIKIGPAKSENVSYAFYADGVGKVAEVARDHVTAMLVYNRKTLTARVLLTMPTVAPDSTTLQ